MNDFKYHQFSSILSSIQFRYILLKRAFTSDGNQSLHMFNVAYWVQQATQHRILNCALGLLFSHIIKVLTVYPNFPTQIHVAVAAALLHVDCHNGLKLFLNMVSFFHATLFSQVIPSNFYYRQNPLSKSNARIPTSFLFEKQKYLRF